MDYKKIDAGLAAALKDVKDQEERVLVVFIHTECAPGAAEVVFLENSGVRVAGGEKQVFTATLSARAVAELTDQPWVRYLRLSRKLRLLK